MFFSVTVVKKYKSFTRNDVVFETFKLPPWPTHTADSVPVRDVSDTELGVIPKLPTRPLHRNTLFEPDTVNSTDQPSNGLPGRKSEHAHAEQAMSQHAQGSHASKARFVQSPENFGFPTAKPSLP